ncbi:MAG: hypothetical protein ACO1QB_16040 [Verrucomicrobiales bacterium]
MKLRLLAAMLAGLLVGIASMYFMVAKTTARAFDGLYLAGVMDQAVVALHIQAGTADQLLSNIERSLPGYVEAVHREFRTHPNSTNALWMIKAFYLRNEIPIPSEIKSILDSLPQKPPTSCQTRLDAIDKKGVTNRLETSAPSTQTD